MTQSPSKQFPGIFVSDRRDDSSAHAGRLFERLANHFGDDQVFMDIDIEAGEDFARVIEDRVGSCEIVIVVMGPHWLSSSDGTTRRLDNPNDFVRLQIATALKRNIRVIPVLVQGATMPRPQDLPDDISTLSLFHAIEISDSRWNHDLAKLIAVLERVLTAGHEARLVEAALRAQEERQRREEAEERLRAEEETGRWVAEEVKRQAQEEKRREEEQRAREQRRRTEDNVIDAEYVDVNEQQKGLPEPLRPPAQSASNIRCTRCGLDQSAEWIFCNRCGSVLGSSQPFASPPVEVQYPPQSMEAKRDKSRSFRQPISDEVTCSVFAPESARRGHQFLVQVFAHLFEQAAQVRQLATEFDSKTQRRGWRRWIELIPRGATLAFELVLPGLEIDEPVQRLRWKASSEPESVSFGVRVPTNYSGETVIGTVIASKNNAPLGHIKFKLSIVSSESQVAASPTNENQQWVRYKRAFISYASPDRKEVLKRVQMLQLAGTEVFQDLLSLEPGERWERALYREIDKSDVFYLFWSSAAKRSEWVMKEVNYAIKRKGNDDFAPPAIVPVIIEGPPPVAPPPELAHLHFNHHIIYFMV